MFFLLSFLSKILGCGNRRETIVLENIKKEISIVKNYEL